LRKFLKRFSAGRYRANFFFPNNYTASPETLYKGYNPLERKILHRFLKRCYEFLMREKTNITLHPEVKKAAQALADGQQRSLSELVERLLEREVERHGQAPRFYMSEQPAAYGQQSSHSAAAAQG
jgi:hypothetical protein